MKSARRKRLENIASTIIGVSAVLLWLSFRYGAIDYLRAATQGSAFSALLDLIAPDIR